MQIEGRKKLRLALLLLLSTIICATVITFIGVNYGDKLTASAAFSVESDTGYTVIQDDDGYNGYFNTYKDGSNTVLTGFSEKTYQMLGVSPYLPGAIPESKPIKMVIPKAVTKIAGDAFVKCSALKEIVFPEGLTTLNSTGALSYTGVTELNLPASVTTINGDAFRGNILEKITVAEGNTAYKTDEGGTCLLSKDGTQLILGTSRTVIPETVTSIEYCALTCSTLKKIKIPASVSSIVLLAFIHSGIEEVDLSENTYFENVNNSGCVVAKSNPSKCIFGFGEEITVPESITSFEVDALSTASIKIINFHGGVNLTPYIIRGPYFERATFTSPSSKYSTDEYGNIITTDGQGRKKLFCGTVSGNVSNDIEVIGDRAFYFRNVTSVTIPESVKEIGDYAFQGTSLTTFNCHDGLTKIGADIVGATPYYYNDANYDNGNVFYLGSYLMKIAQPIVGEYTVREGTTIITGRSFQNFGELTKVTIPDSVTFIANYTFEGCTALTTVYVPASLTSVGGGSVPAQTRLIAPDKAAYDSLKAGALSDYASQLGYEVDATFNVAGQTITKKLLAGQTLGYNYDESTGEWKNTGEFSVGGYLIENWKDASSNVVTLDATTAIPADATALSYTAVDDSGAELETVTKIAKPSLRDSTITYGESFVYPMGYNQSLMNVKFTGTDIFGANYDSTEAPKNVGTYTVSFAPVSGYTWSDGSVAAVTAQLEIKKKVIEEVTWNNLEHLYDGTVPQVWVEIATLEDTMVFKPTVPSADAGTYPLSVTMPDQCNYILAAYANTTANLVIKPRTVKIEWTGMNDFKWVYDGEAHNPTATMSTNLKGANVDYTVAITNGEGTAMPTGAIEAGSYKMTITLANDGTNGNFVFEDGTFVSECDFTILDTVKLQIVWENVADVTYDGKAHNPKAYYTLGNSGEKHYLDVTLKYGTTPTVVPNAINAGNYTATVDVSGVTAPDGSTIAPEDISGDTVKQFTIAKQNVTIDWFNYYATVAYDGNAHNPVAFYTAASGWSVKLDVKLSNASGDVENAIDAGTYTATITSDLSNFNVTGDTSKQFTIETQQTQITQAVWTGTTTFIFNNEEQAPAAMLLSLDGEEVNAGGETVYSYSTASGTALESAPVNVGKYKVTATFVDKTGAKIATTSYDYEIVKAKVAKPVVALSVFASVDEAKAYAPLGYDANTMVISGEEGDGVYVVTVALKNDKNYEWLDGETGAIDFTLKISPDLSATVVGPEGVKYITNNTGNKTVFYALAGTVVAVAVISLIALIVSLRKKNKVSDNGGFYDDYEE